MGAGTGKSERVWPRSSSRMVLLDVQKSIGMKRTASAGKSSSSNGSVKTDSPSHVRGSSYVLCVCNDGYPASLERRKLYRRIRDRRSEQHGLIRVIDESGEDYLYPTKYFATLPVPQRIRRLLFGLKYPRQRFRPALVQAVARRGCSPLFSDVRLPERG